MISSFFFQTNYFIEKSLKFIGTSGIFVINIYTYLLL